MVLAEGSREGVRITVSDSGIGIAPEQQERVFSPFNREDEGVGSSIGGLGLALVRRSVRLHVGTVELHSDVGSGPTVQCHIPRPHTPAVSCVPGWSGRRLTARPPTALSPP